MTAIWAFVKLMWKPLALIAIGVAVLFALRHYGDVRYKAGYHQAVSEDAVALAESQKRYDAQVKADEDRLNAANLAHEKELGQVAAHAAALPVRHLVCKSAPSGGRELPAASHLPAGEAASPGLLAGSDGQDFDPGPHLKDYATDVEYLTVSCRQLMMAVHGFPSTP